MRIFSHDDPELQPFKEHISGYTAREDSQGIPYWVFLDDSKPIGIVSVGKEPIQLLKPLGTPLSMIRVVDPERSEGVIREFISQALRISKDNEVEYVSTSLPAKHGKLAALFREFGFRELANTYRMVCNLDRPFEPLNILRFKRVERREFNRFVDLTIEFMSGSPDNMLNMVLSNLRGLPEDFLDFVYNLDHFYFVYREDQIIGVLDLDLKRGTVSNIGVNLLYRGKGYGRQIILFGLNELKEAGCDEAGLRVHVDNKPAVNLYKSLGFKVVNQYRHLIWQKRINQAKYG
jgi:ribosomal protein S18 acetylase RimI-like enzyme